MKTNIDQLKSKLGSGDRSIIDPNLFREDMKSMFDYYKDIGFNDLPDPLKLYFEDFEEFEFESFSTAYLSVLLGYEVTLEYTEDNYLIVTRVVS